MILQEPGATHGPHRHDHDVVVIEVADGDFTFYPAGTEHTLQNPGDEPLDLVEVEIR